VLRMMDGDQRTPTDNRNDQAWEAGRADRRQRWEAKERAQICGRCGDPFSPDATIWRVGVSTRGRPGWSLGGTGTTMVPMCEGCRPDYAETWHNWVWGGSEPCEACGRTVVNRYMPHRKYTWCSAECEHGVGVMARRKKRAKARQKECALCGDAFQGSRSDAMYCSSACRQKAFRQRRQP